MTRKKNPAVIPEKLAADIQKVEQRKAVLQQEINSLNLLQENLALRAALELKISPAEFEASEIVREGVQLVFRKKTKKE